MSGRSRAPSLGIPLTPVCQEGLLKITLAPPPPEAVFAFWPHWAAKQLLFQTFSGIYDFAVPPSPVSVIFQNVLSCPFSLNCVPPKATTKGLDARSLTEIGPCATVLPLSQPSAPESPLETIKVMPAPPPARPAPRYLAPERS